MAERIFWQRVCPNRFRITGADGLVGSHLCRDPRTRGFWTICALNITDATDIATVLDAGTRHRMVHLVVINAAAQANVNRMPPTDQRKAGAYQTSQCSGAVAVSGRLFEAGNTIGSFVDRLCVDWSDKPGALLREDDPTDPRSVYASTKLEGEQAVLAAGHTVVRIQWVYRPGFRGFFTAAMQRLARQESLALVTDQIGAPTPTFVVADGLLAVAEGNACGLFHLACHGQTSAYGWIRAGAHCLNLPFTVRQVRRTNLAGAERPARSVLDTQKDPISFWLPTTRLARCVDSSH